MTRDPCDVVPASDLSKRLIEHFGAADSVRCLRWTVGHSVERLPWLQVIEATAEGRVHYISSGASTILDRPGHGLEFCYIARAPSSNHVELLAMVAYMHALPQHRLGVGHTMAIGRPVADGSALDRLLVSRPYPYGSDFEYVHTVKGGHARLLWLLPISQAEERYRHEHGLDRLEDRFERTGLDYSDPMRASVV